MKTQVYQHKADFRLEMGGFLPGLNIAYQSYGKLNENADNVIWVCHALTANASIHEWWPGLLGEHKLFDPNRHFIVCANIIGSCYGTTGPLSTNPSTGLPWYRSFPAISIRDTVRAHEVLRKELGIRKISTIIGGSIGAFQALEYSIMFPELIDHLVFIAASLKITPWATAFNQSQRLAIEADPSYLEDRPYGGSDGLKAARSIALLSYRTDQAYNETQRERNDSQISDLPAASYQNYQGEKLVRRFDAYSYHALTRLMDTHNVVRDRGSLGEALGRIKARILAIGISSDRLFPPEEVKLLAHISQGSYREIDSFYGHDGFLLEEEALSDSIKAFWEETAHAEQKLTKSGRPAEAAWVQSA